MRIKTIVVRCPYEMRQSGKRMKDVERKVARFDTHARVARVSEAARGKGCLKPALRVLMLIAALGLSACQSSKNAGMLEYMTGVMASSYHACVPVGWEPVPVDNTFLVGGESEIEQPEGWIGAIWMGFIPKSALGRPRVRAIFRTLRELEKVGMVEHYEVAAGYHFNLTLKALPYFYDGDPLGSNPLRAEYLCYSDIAPDGITSIQDKPNGETWVTFSWHKTADAPWINDALDRTACSWRQLRARQPRYFQSGSAGGGV